MFLAGNFINVDLEGGENLGSHVSPDEYIHISFYGRKSLEVNVSALENTRNPFFEALTGLDVGFLSNAGVSIECEGPTSDLNASFTHHCPIYFSFNPAFPER